MSSQGLSGQGLLMLVLGVWIILRTVTQDSSGRTLIDHILGRSATAQTPGALTISGQTFKTGGLTGNLKVANQNVAAGSSPLVSGFNIAQNIWGHILP